MHPNRASSPLPASAAPLGDEAARGRGIQRATLIAIATNTVLTVGQIVIGLFANAFSLVADAAHTLSDLVTDMMVLVAGRRGADPADTDHPYGHGRIETATTLVLGAVLSGVGIGFLWSSGVRLQNMSALPDLHPAALVMALITLVAKEGLFRFTLAASRRLRAPMLEANAWHARSDAASSLVVAAGIGGSLAGYPFLEPLAAAVVGFLILHMGVKLAWKSVGELIDTGLPEEELQRLRQTIETTPGVIGLHDMRTRRMADRVLCDAHVQVDPRLTVSEGHRVSDAVYLRVRSASPRSRTSWCTSTPRMTANCRRYRPAPSRSAPRSLPRCASCSAPARPSPGGCSCTTSASASKWRSSSPRTSTRAHSRPCVRVSASGSKATRTIATSACSASSHFNGA